MLVLSRRVGEEVVLPGMGVRIVLLTASGGRVRVGVVAPADVVVLRGELSDRLDGCLEKNVPSPVQERG